MGFPSLEAIAHASFPLDFPRLIIARSDGDDGFVLVDGGTENYRYLYGLNCYRVGTEWFEGSSGNGGGWSASAANPELGTWAVWGDAPEGADRVRASYRDEVKEEPIVSGAYLVIWWRRPSVGAIPRTEGFRVGGEWEPSLLWP